MWKTTFLTVAGMLDGFTEGEYELDGVNVYPTNDNERSRLRSEKVGFIFQSFNLLQDLTVGRMSICHCDIGGCLLRIVDGRIVQHPLIGL